MVSCVSHALDGLALPCSAWVVPGGTCFLHGCVVAAAVMVEAEAVCGLQRQLSAVAGAIY
jgi:hypothetical protein